jgi:hypothetical protein
MRFSVSAGPAGFWRACLARQARSNSCHRSRRARHPAPRDSTPFLTWRWRSQPEPQSGRFPASTGRRRTQTTTGPDCGRTRRQTSLERRAWVAERRGGMFRDRARCLSDVAALECLDDRQWRCKECDPALPVGKISSWAPARDPGFRLSRRLSRRLGAARLRWALDARVAILRCARCG